MRTLSQVYIFPTEGNSFFYMGPSWQKANWLNREALWYKGKRNELAVRRTGF